MNAYNLLKPNIIIGTIAVAIAAAVVWHFHDRFWWPVDEGVYAYVAQRVLAGDVIHRDLTDIHAGFGNYINAAAFALWGEDLLSLRYPVAFLTILQSAIAFILLRERGAVVAAVGAVVVSSTSFIQFPNPGAGWYALFLAFATALFAARMDVERGRDLIVLGVFLGVCFLFRQLSGVMLAMGVTAWLLLRLHSPRMRGRAVAGRMLAGIIFFGIAGYMLSKSSFTAFIGAGLWAMIVSLVVAIRVNVAFGDLAKAVGHILVGAVIPALPFALYYAFNGAFAAWLYDIFFTALLIHNQDFISQANYAATFLASVAVPFQQGDPASFLSGSGWIVTLLMMPVCGYFSARYVIWNAAAKTIHPLPVIAVFWSVLAMHYQIPHYFFSAIPVALAAFLWLRPRYGEVVVVALISLWAVYFQAAQPLSRTPLGAIAGERVPLGRRSDLPKVSLRIETNDAVIFHDVIDRIERDARTDEPLMTIPMEPELNFMTDRRSPVDYYSTALGLLSEADVAETLRALDAAAPIFVVNRRNDKYLTPLSVMLLDEVRKASEPPEQIGPFDLYRYQGRVSSAEETSS